MSAFIPPYFFALILLSSKLYMTFSHCLLLSRGHTLYTGPAGLDPTEHFASKGIVRCPEGYNIADWLLEVASGPESTGIATAYSTSIDQASFRRRESEKTSVKREGEENSFEKPVGSSTIMRGIGGRYATTFLTQFEVLAGREWKTLKRHHHVILVVVDD